MGHFAGSFEGMQFDALDDEDAIPNVDLLVRQLDSRFLTKTVMDFHERKGKRVRIRDHINLVFTLSHPPNRLVSFIFAELEPADNLGRLHVMYVLRDYRRKGNGLRLLRAFDALLKRASFERVLTAPVTHASAALFQRHVTVSALKYELFVPDDSVLTFGDGQVD